MKTAVISPSGKFYGSEQVLYDWLSSCNQSYRVYVPANSEFEKRLKQKLYHRHRIETFYSVYTLYLDLFWRIFLGRISTVYQNEGGHIRYSLMLGKLFKRCKFIIHLRILEDMNRVPSQVPLNISLITISRFMQNQLDQNTTKLVYDSFPFNDKFNINKRLDKNIIHVGIIGRISQGKGLGHIVDLCRVITETGSLIKLHLFGQRVVSDDASAALLNELDLFKSNIVIEHGFKNIDEIYTSIDMVLHLAKSEPLGRIFFESLNEVKPFIGFKSGGIGELGKLCKNTKYFIPSDTESIPWAIVNSINDIASNYKDASNIQVNSKQIAIDLFNQKLYNQKLSRQLN